MRRTARVLNDDPTSDAVATVYHSRHKIAWTPRERRLHHHVPVEFKVRGCEEWQQGISQNVSHSGLLLKCAMPLVEGQSLELKLEMPSELTGETPAQVLCRGLVARVTELPATAKNPREFLAGCSIVDYEFASKRPSRAVVQTINIVTLKKRHYIG